MKSQVGFVPSTQGDAGTNGFQADRSEAGQVYRLMAAYSLLAEVAQTFKMSPRDRLTTMMAQIHTEIVLLTDKESKQ